MPNPNSYQYEEHHQQLRAKRVLLLNSNGSIVESLGNVQATVYNNAVATYNSSATTILSGATVGFQVDSTGALWVTKSTLDAGEDLTANRTMVEIRCTNKSLTSLSTVLAHTGAGVFHSFNIGMPSCPTISFYDGLLPNSTLIHRIAAGYPLGTHPLNISLTTGLVADATSGGVIPAVQMSVRQ